MNETVTGAEALIRALKHEGVDIVFGYPGASIMPVYDRLYDYRQEIRHVLTRHEQCAVHAAEGYARVTGRTGVVVATSGPGATNLVTGIADALMDSTPVVVITGQVASPMLGTDAFQETDVVGVTQPVSKWSFQIRHAADVAWAVARAFYIASSGRPGPVVLDFAKDAQLEQTEFSYSKCDFIRSYRPMPKIDSAAIERIAGMINQAERPMIIAGHGVAISGAEELLMKFAEKTGIPVASTLLGLSNMPSDHPLYMGMTGMHGNIAVNVSTNKADLILAIGMRFDDRVTGDPQAYARRAQIVHIDIDESEFDKNVPVAETLHADALQALEALMPMVDARDRSKWTDTFRIHQEFEREKIMKPELNPSGNGMTMAEVVSAVSELSADDAVTVADVGLNEMMCARYTWFRSRRSFVASGGLGTMGFGLPAAIGAKLGAPERQVILFIGDGGLQMSVQELGTVLENRTAVKIVLLNNNFLGNVRQLQTLFCDRRYSGTPLVNPDFVMLARSYDIPAENVENRDGLRGAIERMLGSEGCYLLNVAIDEDDMVFPMTPGGKPVDYILVGPGEVY